MARTLLLLIRAKVVWICPVSLLLFGPLGGWRERRGLSGHDWLLVTVFFYYYFLHFFDKSICEDTLSLFLVTVLFFFLFFFLFFGYYLMTWVLRMSCHRCLQCVVKSLRTCRPEQFMMYQVHLRLYLKTFSEYFFVPIYRLDRADIIISNSNASNSFLGDRLLL